MTLPTVLLLPSKRSVAPELMVTLPVPSVPLLPTVPISSVLPAPMVVAP